MANCLSLSDHGLFGHKEMTEAQLKGEFSPDDKLNYLLGQLSEIEKGVLKNERINDRGQSNPTR